MSARILIVEDEESLTLLLRYNLEKEGFLVEAVARGDEAEIRLKERTPDLVLLDWMLPGVSGIELCRRLRARPETQGGFKWSSQHGLCELFGGTGPEPRPV